MDHDNAAESERAHGRGPGQNRQRTSSFEKELLTVVGRHGAGNRYKSCHRKKPEGGVEKPEGHQKHSATYFQLFIPFFLVFERASLGRLRPSHHRQHGCGRRGVPGGCWCATRETEEALVRIAGATMAVRTANGLVPIS